MVAMKLGCYDNTSGPNAYTNDVVCDDWEDSISAMSSGMEAMCKALIRTYKLADAQMERWNWKYCSGNDKPGPADFCLATGWYNIAFNDSNEMPIKKEFGDAISALPRVKAMCEGLMQNAGFANYMKTRPAAKM